MAHIRRLPGPGQPKDTDKPKGLWQATIRHPSGKRYSRSDPLKKVVQEWADEQERKIRRGEFIDPHAGKLSLGDWWEKWFATKRIEQATVDAYTSRWRNHIDPSFGSWPLSSIQSWDVEKWVTDLIKNGVGKPTVQESLALLSQMMEAAQRHQLITTDPTSLVRAPTPERHVDRFLSREEADRLLKEFKGTDLLLVKLMLYCGLRFQEAAGLRRFRVDFLRKRLQVARVQPRKGDEKRPKSDAGTRPVPLTDELVADLSLHIPSPDDGLVITGRDGGRVRSENWRKRVWLPAIQRAGLQDPQPTPHDLRHTYGSWLAEKNVPPHQIAALMGHASLRSVERYIHASEARFEQARRALGVRSDESAARPVEGTHDAGRPR